MEYVYMQIRQVNQANYSYYSYIPLHLGTTSENLFYFFMTLTNTETGNNNCYPARIASNAEMPIYTILVH